MILTIHNANLKKVAFIDNDKQGTLNYYNDTWHRLLETATSTFEFTVFKKALEGDTHHQRTYNFLHERAYVSFFYKGKSFLFNIMTVEEDEETVTCYCENLNLELINEYVGAYKSEKARSFVEYCNLFDLLNLTQLTVGINEVSDQKKTLEWEGEDTKLARLLSLAKKFDAEIEFETFLKVDSTIKEFRLNVYHEYDDTHQGVGRVRDDIRLTYGKNLKSIKRKVDKTGIYTMIRPTGRRMVKNEKGEEVEEVVTIAGLDPWRETNADGVLEFYQDGEVVVAPLAASLYPSTFSTDTQQDQWIRKDMQVESENPTVIRASAIANLKKNAYPSISYEVDGFLDVEIGDTIKIYDEGFNPTLLVKGRVTEQKISFTNPASNITTFSNFKALENRLSGGIKSALERLFEESRPYQMKLSTSKGVIFKNQIGESVVTPSLYRGGKPVISGVTWRFALDGEVSTGMTYTVKGEKVKETATLTISAYVGNSEVALEELSFVNVIDGKLGTPGPAGKDGRTPYVHTAWANNSTGSLDFSLESSINKLYIGIYSDFTPEDSPDPARYKWTKIKGEDGAQGIPGKAGTDGKTPYVHFAYAESSDGTRGFSTSQTTNKRYMGTYTDFVEADSPDPARYKWLDMGGDLEIGGVNLLKGTRTFSSAFTYNPNSVSHADWKYKGFVVNSASHLWGGLGQLYEVQTGETYTFSAFVASSKNNDSVYYFCHLNDGYQKEKAVVDKAEMKVSAHQYFTRFFVTFTVIKAGFIAPRFERSDQNATLYTAGYQLERGNVLTDWKPNPSDIDDTLGEKADASLTQEQLNALSERAQIQENELKAKATMDALSDLEKAYQSFVTRNKEEQAKSEKALIEAGNRLELLSTQFGGMKELKSFIDTYMSSSNEGLIIGKNDASSTIKVSHDRISMFSAGREVMYISQGVIHIDNGIFTASVQIGRFRTEQYHANLDMNVIRYIG